MKKIIGYLKNITIEAFAKDTEGHLRPLHPGEAVYVGEIVVDRSGNLIPDALRTSEENKVENNSAEENVGTHVTDEDFTEKKKSSSHNEETPRSTTSTDQFDSEYAEANIQSPLRSNDVWTENTGLTRDLFDGEDINIDAPLRQTEFEFHERPVHTGLSGYPGNTENELPPVQVFPETPHEVTPPPATPSPVAPPSGPVPYVANDVTLSISGTTKVEEGDPAVYTITLSKPALEDMIVKVEVKELTTNGDITPAIYTLTIPKGSTSVSLTVDNIDDVIKENPEDYEVRIVDHTEGGFDNVTIPDPSIVTTIIDETPPSPNDENDPNTPVDPNPIDSATVALTGPTEVIEGDVTSPYTVTIDQPASDVKTPVIVHLTYSGVALDGTDFTGVR